MDKKKYVVKCTSYQDIYDSFENLFSEWKQSVKEWKADGFGSTRRTVLVTMKNGIQIRFGCYKDDTAKTSDWIWVAYAVPSQKNRDRLGMTLVNKDFDGIFDVKPVKPAG